MTYPSPAYDINGNLVTVALEGGDYSNLPAGYYTTPGQAAVARGAPPSASGAPITAQQVAVIYANPAPQVQQAIQQIFDAPPPPVQYVAPTPPVAQGWVEPIVTPPPTPQQIVAQLYVENGYTPPPAAVLEQIVSGAIVAPLTEPLTPAHAADPVAVLPPSTAASAQNTLATNPASAQTAAQTASPISATMPTMTGVFPDTSAFKVGDDGAENPVMQLVDRDGHLLQWTVAPSGIGYLVQPFYVTAPARVNEKRLIGADADGNPVFQIIDTNHNLVQWTEDHGQTHAIVQPFYVSVGGATASAGQTPAASGAGQVPPATTISLQKPTIVVGRTASGSPIKQLTDAVGVTQQWIENGNQIIDLRNAPTYGVLLHTTATDAPATSPGTGVPAGGGTAAQNSAPNNNGGSTVLASVARPQIQVGTTSAGWPIYQIGDDAYPASANKQKQWIIDPGPPSRIVDIVDAPTYGVLLRDSVTDAAVADHGGGVVTPHVTPPGGSGKLLLAGLAVALLWAAFK